MVSKRPIRIRKGTAAKLFTRSHSKLHTVVRHPPRIASKQDQKKIFKGDTIVLGDKIGTTLEIEYTGWKPMFN